MVLHLLHRGESPANIRILDLRRPTRPDLKEGQASLVDFVQCDISNSDSVYSAFLAPWPSDADTNAPLTVFHTAANIRFYERHPALLLRSAHINIGGTQNVIDACRAAGASVLIYTSSGSVAVRNTRFLLWPWEKSPERFVQSFSDTDKEMPSAHDEFFANYAYTKIKAEELMKAADGTTTNGVTLRTGAIRPGNGVYGPGGDLLCGAFLVRRVNPTWIDNVVENFCAVSCDLS
jgi:nucleoside-diphosphate-sugar epimerase